VTLRAAVPASAAPARAAERPAQADSFAAR